MFSPADDQRPDRRTFRLRGKHNEPGHPPGEVLHDRLRRMKLEPFALERLQSIWENRVAWNVSESGVHPLRVGSLGKIGEMLYALPAA